MKLRGSPSERKISWRKFRAGEIDVILSLNYNRLEVSDVQLKIIEQAIVASVLFILNGSLEILKPFVSSKREYHKIICHWININSFPTEEQDL